MANGLSQVKLGFAPTRRTEFSREEAVRFRQLLEQKLQDLGLDYVGLAGLNEDELLYDPTDVPEVARRFRAAGVQALFFPHCNFGTEVAVMRLAQELRVPVLLWGPRDDPPGKDGLRLRDTQCGLFATGKDLRRAGIPFSYLVNCWIDDALLERGLRNFLAAAQVVKTFRHLRLGQIGTRPAPFASVICSESTLMENFGIEVVPLELGQLLAWTKKRMAGPDAAVHEARELITSKYELTSEVEEDSLSRLAALLATLQEWLQGEGLTAFGLQCWDYLQEGLGVAICPLSGLLADQGIHMACETDLHGAISSALLSAASFGEAPVFFADLTVRHPTNDNAELLWHCGPFPPSLAAPEETPRLSGHYLMPEPYCGVGNFRLREGGITLCRFDGDREEYYLMAGEGHTTDGPQMRGTYVWLEVNDWPQWEERLVQGPYIHHVSGAYGQYAPVLYEACRYLPGVQPDMFDPAAEAIEAWLRG